LALEIEAKMRLTDPDAVARSLADSKADCLGNIFETNTFFDTDEGQLKSSDCGLRIRVEQWEGAEHVATITHKGPRTQSQLKSRHESEVRVDNAQRAAELLGELGYRAVLTFEKRRQRWELDGCWVELDSLPMLGHFIEIEGPSEAAVTALREKLGLAQAPLVKTSYAAMLTAHIREHDLRTDLVRFDDDQTAANEASGEPAATS
jgi:adenylate cyclase class 2